jgi:hypothetical protein
VQFLLVYIKEAHALDSAWPMGGKGAPIVEEPQTLDERKQVAARCDAKLDLDPLPILIDDMDDTAEKAYLGWPDRLYLVGAEGRIAYAGARGPMGFEPDELEDAIRDELGLERERPAKDPADRGAGG